MCIAVAGVIVAFKEEKNAIVDINGNKIKVNVLMVDAKVGDNVLIHAGCAIEVITKKTADEINEVLGLLEEVSLERN